ncbi:MAG: EAL domain-containing protein [Magnetococcales bacterium]|nr:EAL domain-containing protein [Magnetococcales bacterium]
MSAEQGTTNARSSLDESLGGDYSPHSLDRLIVEQDGSFGSKMCSLRISSKFQRIFSSTLQRGVGFEAFCVGTYPDGSSVPSSELFEKVCSSEDWELIDRLRLLLHLKSFKAAGVEDRWIFTNLHPRIMLGHKEPDPSFLMAALEYTGLSPNQVVVALREHSQERQARLVEVIEVLRQLGCLVVFDDFLAESANLDSLWKLRPDIVKLNRVWLENAAQSGRAKRMLAKLVSLVHASGALVLIEQIASEEEAFMAMRMEADFLQGTFWGPHETGVSLARRGGKDSASQIMDNSFAVLLAKGERVAEQDHRQVDFEMGCFSGDVMECAWSLSDGVPLETAAYNLLHIPRVERVYLLNRRGVQSEPDLFRKGEPLHLDPRYKPLRDSTGATWTRRFSFHDAIRNPGVVQLSPPYRSNASRSVCVTLSVTVNIQDEVHVLCCDVEWREGVVL